jgi:hypothetical protein
MKRLMLSMGFLLRQHADGAYLCKVVKDLAFEQCRRSPLMALATPAPERQTKHD